MANLTAILLPAVNRAFPLTLDLSYPWPASAADAGVHTSARVSAAPDCIETVSVKQVKWYQTVLGRLQPALPGESKTESNDQDCRYADPARESEIVGSDTDEEPVQRKQKRKRNRYELDDYFSPVELGEFIGRSRQHVAEVLEKQRIIKWTGQGKRGKYLLTDKGWQFGLMYDPTEKMFHNRNSKRLTTSNAQPVLGYNILKFF